MRSTDLAALFRALATAETIAIGSELLLGQRLDTNSLHVTDVLARLGIALRFKSVVGDDRADIAHRIRSAARRVDLVVLTGGLGPTSDDCTREAVSDAVGSPLESHATAERQLRAWLREKGRSPNEAQMRQARLPRGAMVLRNPAGSAPGFLMRLKQAVVLALPGVPIEARRMLEESVVPMLRRARPAAVPIVRQTLLTYGLPESELEQQVLDLIPQDEGIAFGTLASPLGVTLSLTGTARMRAAIQRSFAKMRARLGPVVYGQAEDTMEEVVGTALLARGLTLATAESCTGGLIGHRLTQVTGSSAYYYGGLVCYSNEAKMRWLGVTRNLLARHGAVSAEVALAMARGVKRRTGASIGVSVTGIAGPTGGTPTKPVGLVYVGLAQADGTVVAHRFQFHGPRDAVKLRASQAALNRVRLSLLG